MCNAQILLCGIIMSTIMSIIYMIILDIFERRDK